MLKAFLLLSFSVLFFANSFAGPRTEYRIQKNGDALVGLKPGQTLQKVNHSLTPVANLFQNSFTVQRTSGTGFITNVTMVPTGATTIYDLESNGTPVMIWQDPNTPDNIHAILMSSPPGDPSFTVRQTKYYFSTDRGTTWAFVADVPSPSVRSGFPAITGLSDGNALIANHSDAGGGTTRAQAFVDAFPGLGSFTALDPGVVGGGAPIWPRIQSTSDITNPNKFIMTASINSTAFDSCFYNVGTSLSSSSYLGYNFFRGSNAEGYDLARGSDGRIGLAYIADGINQPDDNGDGFFMETTDDGVTWSTPIKIFDADFTTDSLGLLRGISIVYQGTSPKVSFEVIKQTATGFFPTEPSKIMFWSSSLPGADPNRSIAIADSGNVPYFPHTGTNDVMAPLCRPSIGVSGDGSVLFVAFMATSGQIGGLDSTAYKNIYLTASGDNGASWKHPEQLNSNTPLRDWSFVSVSKWNDNNGSNTYYANMVVLSDSVPGSFVNGAGNGESLGQQMFVRAEIPGPVFIQNISNETPDGFSLAQNFPNPFNPTTSIRFSLPTVSNVILKVYDMSGKVVATLLNNERVTAGVKEVNFNAVGLSSGIYFYTLQTENFRETKKMVLVK
jgi:hypothetical protein